MDDWIDPRPPFIDSVSVENNYITIGNFELDFSFLCGVYYNLQFTIGSVEIAEKGYFKRFSAFGMENREDRMKVARFMPAFVKDVNVYLKLIQEVFSKHGYFKELLLPSLDYLTYRLVFDSSGMSDEQVIDNVLKRTEAVIEFKRKFREWLVREERRDYWEETAAPQAKKILEMYRWKKILKWPMELKDSEMEKKYVREAKSKVLGSSAGVYDLNGCRLRLAKKTERGLRFLGRVNGKGWVIIDKAKVREEDLNREDIVIAVDDRLEKLPKFPLEKIEFLKEDFPEMFK